MNNLQMGLAACSNDLMNGTNLLITADAAKDEGELDLERLLRWIADNPFQLTGRLFFGSRAYGYPRPDSDWDWLLWLPSSRLQFTFPGEGMTLDSTKAPGALARGKFGPVGVVVVETVNQWTAWSNATAELVKRKPVTRDVAVATYNTHRVAWGLTPTEEDQS